MIVNTAFSLSMCIHVPDLSLDVISGLFELSTPGIKAESADDLPFVWAYP